MRSASQRLYLSVLVLTVPLLTASAPAVAQGFFQSLFGGGGSTPSYGARPYGYGGLYRGSPVVPQLHLPAMRSHPEEDLDRPRMPLTGIYRTVCVRMCDGFYFPISSNVPRSAFYRDADRCRARCGGEAQLFYHLANDRSVDNMVDLNGRAYARLPIAFLHRKRLVEGCTCKPEPWSEVERVRHDGYAMAEAPIRERIARAWIERDAAEERRLEEERRREEARLAEAEAARWRWLRATASGSGFVVPIRPGGDLADIHDVGSYADMQTGTMLALTAADAMLDAPERAGDATEPAAAPALTASATKPARRSGGAYTAQRRRDPRTAQPQWERPLPARQVRQPWPPQPRHHARYAAPMPPKPLFGSTPPTW